MGLFGIQKTGKISEEKLIEKKCQRTLDTNTVNLLLVLDTFLWYNTVIRSALLLKKEFFERNLL